MVMIPTARRQASESERWVPAPPRSDFGSKIDATTMVTVYLILLFGMSARFVVGPIGAAGTPAILVGVGISGLYVLGRVSASLDNAWQPIRPAIVAYVWLMTLSYVLAFLRPLTALEVTGSTREMIRLVAYAGIALLLADAIKSRSRLDAVIRRVVAGGAVLAFIGLFEFATGFNLANILRLPGLNNSHEIAAVTRSIFNRPSATALHPIEFSVVLAALLPLALHVAVFSRRGSRRVLSWVGVALIAGGVPLSISRSGVVGLALGIPFLSLVWPWRWRINGLVAGLGFMTVMYAAVPGLLGTIRGLFQNTGTDLSVQARIERIPRFLEFFWEYPVFGHGYGTFSIEDYLLLDNQYMVSLIEVGTLGVLAFVALVLTGISIARGVRHHAPDYESRHLGQSIAAALLVLLVTASTFDAFFYHIFVSIMFVLLGCAGALWRLCQDDPLAHRQNATFARRTLGWSSVVQEGPHRS